MNYNDNGTVKQITVKAGDTLPVGTEVDVPDGTTIPAGWEEISPYEDYSSSVSSYMKTNYTVYSDGTSIYKIGKLVVMTINGGGTINVNTDTTVMTLPDALKPKDIIVGPCLLHSNSGNISVGQLVIYKNGDVHIKYTDTSGTSYRAQFMINVTYIAN